MSVLAVVFFMLPVLSAVIAFFYIKTKDARKKFQFYWNTHAGRLAILHRRYYEEFEGFVQDGTKSIGPPFRVSKHIVGFAVHGRLMGLVTRHPWFVRDPNLFVPFVSEKYYTFKEQKEMGIQNSAHILEYEDWHHTLSKQFEYWVKGLGFWAKMSLRFGTSNHIEDTLTPEPIYQTRLYDEPISIGGGLVQFRINLSHAGISGRLITIFGGTQVGWHRMVPIYIRRMNVRDPDGKTTTQYLPLTQKEADEMVEKGLVKIFLG